MRHFPYSLHATGVLCHSRTAQGIPKKQSQVLILWVFSPSWTAVTFIALQQAPAVFVGSVGMGRASRG